MFARRALALLGPWLLVVGGARLVVALPERCPEVTAGDARAAAGEAVDWFDRNQRSDGRWVYGYDRDADEVDLRPHVVRHSGVILSLYQANAAGLDEAREIADRGVAWSLDQGVRHDGWLAIRGGEEVRTGGTALLLAGLSERRRATDDPRFDDEMVAMGRFLVAMTEPSGAVLASWSVPEQRAAPGVYSTYFTGEAYLGLALLADVDDLADEGPWAATAERIGHYLATERDDVEDRFPPTSDHWAAYGLAQLRHGTTDRLDADEHAFALRQAGLFGIQVRYESQRTDRGLNEVALRGPRTSGSGVATLGEGLGSLWRLAPPALSGREHEVIGERLRCVAGMLVDRQVDKAEADADAGPDGGGSRPRLTRGAWFASGATRMDDQQHALSALLLAEPALAEPATTGGSGSDDGLGRTLWLLLVAFAVAGPGRLRRLVPDAPTRALVPGVAAGTAALAGFALVAGWLLRTASISPATALVAAGVLVAVGALVDLATRAPAEPEGGTGVVAVALQVVRPVVALLVVAIAGDLGVGVGLVAAVAAGAAALVRLPAGRAGTALRWAVAAVALLGAADLVVDGILSV